MEIVLSAYERKRSTGMYPREWFDYLDLAEELDALYGITSFYDSHKGFRVTRHLGDKITRELWSAIKGGRLVWVVAELDSRYQDHRYYEELSEALQDTMEGICTIQQ